jgi:hypothetical protein
MLIINKTLKMYIKYTVNMFTLPWLSFIMTTYLFLREEKESYGKFY